MFRGHQRRRPARRTGADALPAAFVVGSTMGTRDELERLVRLCVERDVRPGRRGRAARSTRPARRSRHSPPATCSASSCSRAESRYGRRDFPGSWPRRRPDGSRIAPREGTGGQAAPSPFRALFMLPTSAGARPTTFVEGACYPTGACACSPGTSPGASPSRPSRPRRSRGGRRRCGVAGGDGAYREPLWRAALAAAGFDAYRVHGVVAPRPADAPRLAVLTAAREPLSRLDGPADLPWPERVLCWSVGASRSQHAFADFTFAGVGEGPHARGGRGVPAFLSLAPRVLCGDLNTPRRELADGTLLTFAHDSKGRAAAGARRAVGSGGAGVGP